MHRAVEEGLVYGLISLKQRPDIASQIKYARQEGALVSVLPGVYRHRDVEPTWQLRALAVRFWDPNAVVVGEAAAALTFQPHLRPTTVEVANRRCRAATAGFTITRRVLEPEMITTVRGLRISTVAHTALDLAPRTQGDAIDDALRSRMTTLAGLQRALAQSEGRAGNVRRRQLLLDSRGEPWSSGERRAHCELRAAGITRWRANVPIVLDGQRYFQDIAFDDGPLVAEIDGIVHLRPDVFETDRIRGNALLLAGKQVLHFTTKMLDVGLLVPTVLSALRLLR